MPAAAVIRSTQALPGITGRKALRRRFCKSDLKGQGSTLEMGTILQNWRMVEVSGIAGVGVKSVDISRNTNGEGSSLGHS